MNAKHINNLKVISLELGQVIAKADNVIYDPVEKHIEGITVTDSGSDMHVILLPDIKKFGIDAIMVDSDTSLKNLSEVGKTINDIVKDGLFLINTKVVTEDGVDLGKVADFSFDPATGTLTDIEITQGMIKDIDEGRKKIMGSNIVKIGQNTTIVKEYKVENFASQPKGGLQGMLGGMQTKVANEKKNIDEKKKTSSNKSNKN